MIAQMVLYKCIPSYRLRLNKEYSTGYSSLETGSHSATLFKKTIFQCYTI